ncbi:hypothetical protein K5E_08400 [Enterococcus thailandicus]|uniref:helix-turn-helix domain-containing protein n=1 Tax=Enterococcus TaxID=1350 RepID=UPI00244D9513|nr:helix-turn-helix transcriptional regulator [Enterococcus thailandicus]GMC03386.1 hypothetical protein K4E_09080 [Enterococcus thailandicus]GMC08701.1 hypothetical protein K5E_08400 [Enterococcus thailandicus]
METRLRNLRKKNNLTQEDLSIQLKVSRQTISNWERGFSQPDMENLHLIARFFKVPISYLIDGSDSETITMSDASLTETITSIPLDNQKLSLLKLLTLASCVTPLAAFGLLFLVNEYKYGLNKKQYKFYSKFGYFLSAINLVVIALVIFDLTISTYL